MAVTKDFDYLTKQHQSQQLFKKKRKSGMSIFVLLTILSLVVIVVSWIVYWAGGAKITGNIDPAGILEIFTAPIQGFIDSASIIIFLLILSAFLKIINDSKALSAGIGSIFLKLKGKETLIIIILFLIFTICGTTHNMCEATLVFYFLLIPVLTAAGFDKFTALLVICFGAGIGVAGSTVNPVLVNNATDAANQGIAALYPTLSANDMISTSQGLAWRCVILVVLVAFGLGYTLWYAKRVRKDPTKGFCYGLPGQETSGKFDVNMIPALTARRKATLIIFGLTFVLLIIGALPWGKFGFNGFDLLGQTLAKSFPYIFGQSYDPVTHTVKSNIAMIGNWGLAEMAFLFLIMGVIAALVNWDGANGFFSKLIAGAAEFVGVAFIVALCGGFSVLLAETGIQSVLINAVKSVQGAMAPPLFALVLFILFCAIAFFIPSVSGFSRSVFPIVGPSLSGGVNAVNGAGWVVNGQTLSGMTVSGSIATFSVASGWINLVAPTAFALVLGAQISDVPLSRFYKRAWFLWVGIFVLSALLIVIGTFIPMTSGVAIF